MENVFLDQSCLKLLNKTVTEQDKNLVNVVGEMLYGWLINLTLWT